MRVLIPPGSGEPGQQVSLDENEIHHLRVRRARDRENVEILDGAGLVGTGRLIQAGSQWLVEVRTSERRTRPPELTLAVAAGDRERFSWMVEKAVELGVTGIVPWKRPAARVSPPGSRMPTSAACGDQPPRH